jgi:excinuclease UvrABC nuclease subunit
MTDVLRLGANGASGTRYELQLYPLRTEFRALPGVYMFTKRAANGNWDVLYVGQTHDLQRRVGSGLSQHHKINKAVGLGATHIGVLIVHGTEATRLGVEADLCKSHAPVCNDLPTSTANALLGPR